MTFHSEKVIQINNFDGQTVWVDKIHPLFEVGNFLGGGAAGTVYECEYIKSKERYALKILNPLGYKLMTPTLLRKTHILTKGKPLTDDNDPNISLDHVWWLLNNSTKQYIAAYFSEKSNCLKELSLNQCVAIWTAEPPDIVTIDDENPNTNLNMIVLPNGQRLFVPKIPPKFVEFIRKRSRIFREINNMRKISNHPNVIKLEGVLELVQETKCTIFLVMELANGGELFDRIKVDCGTREDTAKFFFQQLLGGVKHCHDQGVCHRDLKPENLLLQDTSDRGTILKIADFGFSARFAMATGNNNSGNGGITGIAGMSIGNNNNNNSDKESNHWSQPAQSSNQGYIIDSNDYMASGSPVRVLKSIVGSPFYVAPEILQARGYDGAKADIWSLGVILYAMLAGNLPFGQDLSICKRFKTFCKWVRQYNLKTTQLWDHPSLDFPEWLFPSKFSNSSKGLIVSMLHPDPLFRISVAEAMQHPLCIPVSSSELVSSQGREIPMLMSSTDVAATSTDRHDYNDHNDNDDDNNNNSNNNNNGGSSSNGSNSSSKNSNAMIVSHQDSLLMKGAHEEEDDDDGDDKGISVRRSIDESDQETGDEDFRNEEKENDYDDQSGVFIMEEDREEYVEKISSRSMTSTIVSKSQQVSPLSNTSKHDMYNNLFPDMSQSFSTATSSMMSESFLERNNFGLASSPPGAKPPIAHHVEAPHSIDDLITNETDEFDSEATLFGMSKPMHSSSSSGYYDSLPPKGPLRRERSGEDTGSTNNHPPSFTDAVKKSTRFITAVPAFEVLIQVEKILSDCRDMKIITPIGLIGKVILDWDTFRLEVWGQDVSSPSVCALQMYQLPSAYGSSGGSGSTPSTPSRMATTDIFSSRSQAIPINTSQPSNYYSCSPSQGVGSLNSSTSTAQQELYLVEFVRGQLEIFAFKRFYQWLRQKLSELVKKDYSLKLFEHSVSPK